MGSEVMRGYTCTRDRCAHKSKVNQDKNTKVPVTMTKKADTFT